jgi:acetyl-CoA carboxylase biotin carboxyl carrier protein
MDRERIGQVIALLKSSTSVELSVEEGDTLIRVRRLPQPPAAFTATAPAGASSGPSAAGSAPVPGGATAGDVIVRARLVGRFYHGKGAGQPPIVRIGDRVEEDQVVATLEALGKLTGVPAPEAGDVIELLTEDGKSVEYGAPLMRLRRPGG